MKSHLSEKISVISLVKAFGSCFRLVGMCWIHKLEELIQLMCLYTTNLYCTKLKTVQINKLRKNGNIYICYIKNKNEVTN